MAHHDHRLPQMDASALVNAKPIPKNPANQTPSETVGKVLHLRGKITSDRSGSLRSGHQ
ncbi:hypothetical protein [Novosphingobium album (ex Hu et al. 2023)]|uniref:Uncharacterized protein n=1 Tax=Novosphingobium album (ex Hu et al. 2023) TaxID=2930093 RepID=A0ABT0B4J0_9SPHN|nr:hypothetical protein [Novosphingobium album (ex Hu et al. 2023)]MCJ2179793.1 hypothetical protein [Novosphingobium album (ex Hu et al. 2023)]